jgi:dUTP pyrophosphatase
MKVKIKLLSDKAKLPKKHYQSDFCYDVVATSCEEIAPDVYRYGTDLAFELERDTDCANEDLISIEARPRSSIWKTGMVLSNSIGTIDEEYRGEVQAVFYHVMKDMPKYEVGDRIFQITISSALPMEFEIVRDELTTTNRGANGYGSTGR